MILAQQLLVLLAALAAAATVAITARQVALAPRGGKALAAYRAEGAAPAVEVDINQALGLVKPAYARYLYLLAVAGVAGVLLLAGMPLAPALGGGARGAGDQQHAAQAADEGGQFLLDRQPRLAWPALQELVG